VARAHRNVLYLQRRRLSRNIKAAAARRRRGSQVAGYLLTLAFLYGIIL
jgi:hypothetical protein